MDYVIYNKKTNICEITIIPKSDREYKKILSEIYKIYEDVIIWIGLFTDKKSIELCIKNDFNMPYITSTSPTGRKFKNDGIAFIKCPSLYKILYNSEYLYDMLNNNDKHCRLIINFTDSSLRYFKTLLNLKTEVSGILTVGKIYSRGSELYLELREDKNWKMGDNDEVSAVFYRHNFHTHPYVAYTNNNVKNGWPSCNDYHSLILLKDTIFHIVITIEGIYMISFINRFKNSKKIEDFIYKEYDIDKTLNITPEEYTYKINNIRYRGKYQIFDVKFRRWANISSNDKFSIIYDKNGKTCVPSQEKLDILRYIK